MSTETTIRSHDSWFGNEHDMHPSSFCSSFCSFTHLFSFLKTSPTFFQHARSRRKKNFLKVGTNRSVKQPHHCRAQSIEKCERSKNRITVTSRKTLRARKKKEKSWNHVRLGIKVERRREGEGRRVDSLKHATNERTNERKDGFWKSGWILVVDKETERLTAQMRGWRH